MTAKVIVLILLFLAANLFGQSSRPKIGTASQSDVLLKRISSAETFQISGDLINAEIENRAIVAIALQRLGNISIEEGRIRDAIQQLSESASYADNARVRIDLAIAYIQSNKLSEALEQATAAVRLDPKFAYGRYVLGNIYFTKGDYQAALPELERVMILEPNLDAARALGLTYLYLKQPERAKLLFEEMQAAMKKDTASLHILFGQAYEQTNYPLEAEREFKRALAINPAQPKASFFLGYVILQYGGSARLAEAGRAFEQELRLTPNDYFANFFAGVAASSQNDHQKAETFLRKAVQLNSQSSEANLFLGQSQIELKDLKGAEKSLRRAIELTTNVSKNNFETRRAHYLLGRLLVQAGRRDEGEAELAKARDLQTKFINVTREEISELFSKVVGTDNTFAKSPEKQFANRAVELAPQQIAELKAARAYLSEVVARAFYNIGVIAVQSNRLDAAFEKFSSAATWKPDFPNLNRSLGIVAFRMRKFDASRAPLERQLKADPSDARTRQMLGANLYFLGDFKAAVETLRPLAPSITSDSELAYFYGVSLIQTQKNQEAVPVFEKLAAAGRTNSDALTYAAQGFMFLGDYERAVKEFSAVAAVSPDAPKIRFFIGQALIRLNRFADAEKAFRQELQINPADESAKYHLALTLIERKINTDEAIALLNEAITSRPDYADALYQLGKIYNERGDTVKAIEKLEAAAAADAKKDYVHYQLGIAYRKASRPIDAERELKLYQQLKAANRRAESLMPMGMTSNAP